MNEIYLAAAKSTAVLSAAFLASVLFRRASAAVRHLIWMSALAAVLVLPALDLLLPALPLLPAGNSGVAAAVTSAPARAAAPAASRAAVVSPAPREWPTSAWLLLMWAAGAALVLARYGAAVLRLGRIRRRATALHADLRVPVLASPEVGMPMTAGIFRTAILLPETAASWPAETLRVVLAHEQVHVARRDCLMQLVARLSCAAWWFHPLAWLAESEARKERERACDDAVLRLGVRASDYASLLVDLARTLSPAPRCAAAVAMAQPSHLRTRIESLLDNTRRRAVLTRRRAALAAVVAGAIVIPVAALRAQAAGRLSGTVEDPSGGRVPGARVTVVCGDQRKDAVVAPDGAYSFSSLPAGRCSVQVRSAGFAVFTRPAVEIPQGAEARLNVVLEIGELIETVDVVASGRPTSATPGPKRIRVGGNVQASRLIHQVKPAYPEEARLQGIEGTVLLQAVISTGGSLLSLRALNSADRPELVKAAMDAVNLWRYQPTLLNGVPVEVVTTIMVNFRLEQ